MGMPLELQTLIVTKGKERRVKDNLFILEKEGYRLYPLDIPLEVRRTLQSEASSQAVVKKLELADNRTIVTYELVALHSTN
ncbi:DUF2584 domain-containing protein [Saccharococcus caldoxylosilyticus]|uniref:DUF2584 domain-containing protein n=1 Tax=Saccharococcus caldoxylosilyticus TaxID=81408 RepID=UPI001FCA5864|nr:DUF2584 domain-containing protein [Parageobacillus caldoxylosilyticus]BDG37196.1 hypothetical protein PcaKH15_31020 [Parageobacillus caldoxylosilyticus]BDG40987.1 hypothetical protein PcaKH16_31260 [Parageobacillus caldoxylosilyticus]BDG44737.1 hypothetical protein PcaKH35_30820 [Parageobacillus caldoxylosilyticus]